MKLRKPTSGVTLFEALVWGLIGVLFVVVLAPVLRTAQLKAAASSLRKSGALLFSNRDDAVVSVNLSQKSVGSSELESVAKLPELKVLNLNYTNFDDGALELLSRSTTLRELYLSTTPLSDDGLRHLSGLSNLQWLDLQRTRVTDNGLEHLASLGNLEALVLDELPITDAGLMHLGRLTNLTTLSIRNTQVTDAGLVHLASLTKLTGINLLGTRVVGSGLHHFQNLTRLTELSLHKLPIADAGVQGLRGLQQLIRVDLSGTQVSDGGLTALNDLPNLKRLGLQDTGVSVAGVVAFKTHQPDCLICGLGKLIPQVRTGPIRWEPSDGGNGHYYQVISGPAGQESLTWAQARARAESLRLQGVRGHLATVTSAAEWRFVLTHVDPIWDGNSRGAWLGGFQDTAASDYDEPAGGWRWITGEAWTFSAWNEQEPNDHDDEGLLEFTLCGWNDLGHESCRFLVEFPVDARSAIP